MVVRDDRSIKVLVADESGDLEEVEQGHSLRATRWTSGSLYDDANDILRLEFGDEDDASNVLLFLLTAEGGLHVSDEPMMIVLIQLNKTDIPTAKLAEARFHSRWT